MPKVDTKLVKKVIDLQIAQKTATMDKRAPANVKDEKKWQRAKSEARKQYGSKLPEDRFYAVVNHIYQNMGGEFAKKEGQKAPKMPEDKSETKKRDDSHECPSMGTKLKKSDEDKQRHRTKPGWTKYECPESGYSKDFRDGAPIYQAKKVGSSWGFFESGAPLFFLHAEDVPKKHRKAFLAEGHGITIANEMAKEGAYEYVRKWFPDGEGITIVHPGLRLAAMGVEGPIYKLIARDALTGTEYKKSAAKTRTTSSVYGDLLALADKREEFLQYLTGPSDVSRQEMMDEISGHGEAVNMLSPWWWIGKFGQAAGSYAWQVVEAALADGKSQEEAIAAGKAVAAKKKKNKKAATKTYKGPWSTTPAAIYLGPGKVHIAQGAPEPGDVGVAEPGIEESVSDPNATQQTEPPALVEPETSDALTGETKDYSNITEAISDVVAAIVSNSDAASAEDVLTELKNVFSNDDEFARFRGKIEEKVEGERDSEAQGEVMAEAPPSSQSPAGDMGQPDEPQVVAAVKKEAQKWEAYARQVWAVKQKIERELIDVQAQLKHQEELEEELQESKKLARRLLVERSARIRAPRAVRVAQKMYRIGELGEGEEDAVVRTALDHLMTMTEDDFLANEDRVNRIYAKVREASSSRSFEDDSTEGQSILTFVPVTTQKEERDFLGKRRGSSNIEEYYPWSRGDRIRRVS